jgi:hypothetical protein
MLLLLRLACFTCLGDTVVSQHSPCTPARQRQEHPAWLLTAFPMSDTWVKCKPCTLNNMTMHACTGDMLYIWWNSKPMQLCNEKMQSPYPRFKMLALIMQKYWVHSNSFENSLSSIYLFSKYWKSPHKAKTIIKSCLENFKINPKIN